MDWKKTTRKILFFVAMLLVLGMFTFLHGFFDSASAPFEYADDAGTADGEQTAPSGTPLAAEPPAVPDEALTSAGNEEYVIIRMSPADVFRGNLLLINHDHRFEIPAAQDFISISEEKTMSYSATGDDLLLAESAIESLNNMMDDFLEVTGRDNVTIISAYRGYERQQEILSEYIKLMGSAGALRLAAPPGYSEHHAGLAVDLGYYSNGVLRTFQGTGVYAWFKQNSHNHGFILRFPGEKSEITKTAYEPWHFRYVGQPHAFFINQNDWCLEEYIDVIMRHTRDEPFTAIFNECIYEVYFTEDAEIFLPFDCEFDISGNNINGFIVTVKQ